MTICGHRRQAATPSCAHQRHLLLTAHGGAIETTTGTRSTILLTRPHLRSAKWAQPLSAHGAANLKTSSGETGSARSRTAGITGTTSLRYPMRAPASPSGPHAKDQRTRLLRASARTPRRRFGRARVAVGGARHGRAACQPWVGALTWPANCPNSGQAMIPTRMGPGHLPTSKSLDLRAAITPEKAASVSWSTEMRDALSSIVSPRSLPTHRSRAESPHPKSVLRPPAGVQ